MLEDVEVLLTSITCWSGPYRGDEGKRQAAPSRYSSAVGITDITGGLLRRKSLSRKSRPAVMVEVESYVKSSRSRAVRGLSSSAAKAASSAAPGARQASLVHWQAPASGARPW